MAVDVKTLRILSDALRESIILMSGTPVQTFPYENWERTWEGEFALDSFFFRRDPLDRGLYIPDGSSPARSRRK